MFPDGSESIVSDKVCAHIASDAPIIINTDNMKGGQLIVEDDLEVRFPIYEILKKAKEEAEK